MKKHHTPGPWSVGRCSWNDEGNVCYELEGIRQGCAADARLIAAAPDLLSALNAMLTHMGMDEDEWNKPTFDQARAAIVKATGAA